MSLGNQSESEFFIAGSEGRLQAAISNLADFNTVGIFCHPHPLYGGTMNNKVVTTVIRTWQKMKLQTVRFNFRGVGESAGHYGNSIGELEDLKAIFDWVNREYPGKNIWLGGFSFGSYIAAKFTSQTPEVKALLTIAPPVHHDYFDDLPPISAHWLVIHGTEDELVPFQHVEAWIREQRQQNRGIQFLPLSGASHFFHGKLILLQKEIQQHMFPWILTQ